MGSSNYLSGRIISNEGSLLLVCGMMHGLQWPPFLRVAFLQWLLEIWFVLLSSEVMQHQSGLVADQDFQHFLFSCEVAGLRGAFVQVAIHTFFEKF